MALKIIILEDNLERQRAMGDCLTDRFHQYEVKFFDTAAGLIQYLHDHLSDTIVLALDHDLELKPGPDGRVTDCGTGREVADFLATKPPVCPVVVHSTNNTAAQGMIMVLQDAHWKTYQVSPWGDLEWIPTQWFRTMRQAILGMARKKVIEKT